MNQLKSRDSLEVLPIETTFSNLSEIYGQIDINLNSANVIVLPEIDHIPEDLVNGIKTFHRGIEDVYEHFSQAEEIQFEIYALDNEIRHLSLNSNEYWLGTFIVGTVVTPFFINLLTSYVYEKLKVKSGDKISVQVIVEKEGKSMAVKYNGNVENFDQVINEIKKLDD